MMAPDDFADLVAQQYAPFTTQAEARAIAAEVLDRLRLADRERHIDDLRRHDRALFWHRVRSIAIAVGVSALGWGMVVALICAWWGGK